MLKLEKDNYLLIQDDKKVLSDFASTITKEHKELGDSNVIVDLSEYNDLKTESLLLFLEVSRIHQEKNKSFVLVNDTLGIDDLPEELIVVPTLQEAEDLIQMDEIQRDLGF